MSNESYWSLLKNNFKDIINTSEYYKNLFNFIHNFENNILLYGKYGYPSDLFIEEIIKYKFNISTIYRTECVWNKNVIYNENQNFFEIDLINPNMPKDFSFLSELILHIIKSKSIINVKHFIIIKHIDILIEQFFTFDAPATMNLSSLACPTRNQASLRLFRMLSTLAKGAENKYP
jgi:hypothetical protein